MSDFEGILPPKRIEKIWCDFNACGLSQEKGDDCYYSFDRIPFYALPPSNGRKLFIWDESDEDEVIGYVATLEEYSMCVSGWRARPDKSTWYRGSPRLIGLSP